jgi:fucose permease
VNSAFVRQRGTWLSYAFLSFYSYFINSMGPLTVFVKSDLGLSYTIASLHYSAFALGILLIGFAGGPLVARIGRWRALWLAVAGLCVGAVVLIAGRTSPVTIGASFIMGFVGSLIMILVPSILADIHGESRAVALSEANVLAEVVAASSPLLLGFFTQSVGNWRPAMAIPLLAPAAMIFFFRKEREVVDGKSAVAPEAELPAASRARLPRLYWVYWVGILLAEAAEFGMTSWSSDYLATSVGLSKVHAAWSLSLFMVAVILGRLAGSRLVQRFTPHALMLASVGVALAGFAAYWLGAPIGAPLVLAGLFVAGLGISGLYPFVMSLALGVAGTQTVRASANATLAAGAAILCLPFLLGRLADSFGIRMAYLTIPVVLIALALLVVASMRAPREARPGRAR